MPTNPNMVAIQTVTVGSGGAANIEFTSIPQTYTDLIVKYSLRDNVTSGGASNNATISFNGSSANGTSRELYGNGASAASASLSNAKVDYHSSANATANTFGSAELYIPNYTSSNNKSSSSDGVSETNATTALMAMNANLWSQTAAITSLSLAPSGGSWVQYSTATLYGVTSAGYGAKATGGIITQDNNYFYHTFLASGTFTPTQSITADYLVVAGGGGGGKFAGGGGAGGLRSTVTATGGGGSLESALSLTASTNYTVTIGAGGTGAGASPGGNGSNSVFSTITSTGGGGSAFNANGSNGGSGGGCALNYTGGTGTANQGYAGGNGRSDFNGGSGGGGAGQVGANSPTGHNGAAGGNGVTTSISGTSVTYAGGGGGGADQLVGGTTGGTGGTGGGGAGYPATANGGTNTGGGAGGGGRDSGGTQTNGGNGGSGIVIVRYSK